MIIQGRAHWSPTRRPEAHSPGNRCAQQEHRAQTHSSDALKRLLIIFISEHSCPFLARIFPDKALLPHAPSVPGCTHRKESGRGEDTRNIARYVIYEAASSGPATLTCAQPHAQQGAPGGTPFSVKTQLKSQQQNCPWPAVPNQGATGRMRITGALRSPCSAPDCHLPLEPCPLDSLQGYYKLSCYNTAPCFLLSLLFCFVLKPVPHL